LSYVQIIFLRRIRYANTSTMPLLFRRIYMREALVVSRLSACYSWFMGSHVVWREMVVVVSSHRIPLLFISWRTPWSLREWEYYGYRSDASYKIHDVSSKAIFFFLI